MPTMKNRAEMIAKANKSKGKRESSFDRDKRERSQKNNEYAGKPAASSKPKTFLQDRIEKEVGDKNFFN